MAKQTKRVALVVEGISDLARLILDALQREDIACRVVLTHDGVEALDYLLGRSAYAGRDVHVMPCVTLLDLSLPGMDGLGLMREIRAHEQTRLLPMVAFTSADKHQEASAVYASGPTATSAQDRGSRHSRSHYRMWHATGAY